MLKLDVDVRCPRAGVDEVIARVLAGFTKVQILHHFQNVLDAYLVVQSKLMWLVQGLLGASLSKWRLRDFFPKDFFSRRHISDDIFANLSKTIHIYHIFTKPSISVTALIYTGVSVSELFGYRDPPFSDLLSEQILSKLFDPRGLDIQTSSDTETRSWSRYPNSIEQWFAIQTIFIRRRVSVSEQG